MRRSLSAMAEMKRLPAARREHEGPFEIQLDCSRLLGAHNLHLWHSSELCGKYHLIFFTKTPSLPRNHPARQSSVHWKSMNMLILCRLFLGSATVFQAFSILVC